MNDMPGCRAVALPTVAQATFTGAFCENVNSLGTLLSFKGFFMLLPQIKDSIQVAGRELCSRINRKVPMV